MRESKPLPQPATRSPSVLSKADIELYIDTHQEELLSSIRLYVSGLSAEIRQSVFPGESVGQIAQDVLVDVRYKAVGARHTYNPAKQFDPSKGLGPWLRAIVLNHLKDQKKRGAGRVSHEQSLQAAFGSAVDSGRDGVFFDRYVAPDAVDETEGTQMRDELDRLLRLLSEDDRQVIQLVTRSRDNGLHTEAAAHILGITPNATRVRFHRALKRLRAIVQQQGWQI